MFSIRDYEDPLPQTGINVTLPREDDVYNNRKLAIVPFWYHLIVGFVLSIMGVIGTSLNGFVIWSFALRRVVSKHFYIVKRFLV